jgi:hypothetical protein
MFGSSDMGAIGVLTNGLYVCQRLRYLGLPRPYLANRDLQVVHRQDLFNR